VAGGATCCGSTAATDQATTATDQPATVRHDEAHRLPVVVIGVGPVRLAAAAHLHERGLPFTVLEAGPGPGASVAAWGHVRLFSPWRYNIDALVPLPPEGLRSHAILGCRQAPSLTNGSERASGVAGVTVRRIGP
jgi:hypothetical protein